MPLMKKHEVPNDIGDPLEIPDVFKYNLDTLHKFTQGAKMTPVFIILAIGFFLLPPLIAGVPTFFFAIPLFIILLVGQRTAFSPKVATSVEKTQNEEIFRRIYEATKSNFWSRTFVILSAMDDIGMYKDAPEQTVSKIRSNIKKEHEFAKSDCSGGHTPKCAHRLPDTVKSWLAQA